MVGNLQSVIRIGYDDSITKAQEIARRVLTSYPAVLNDPGPSVLYSEAAVIEEQERHSR